MRLLNTQSLTIEEFTDHRIAPQYAILSHVWGKDEVTYKDYMKGRFDRNAAGYRKIVDCCALAKARGQDWVWIDTCCIDKRSSAELSEAINAMYAWYQAADECYVHLADVNADLSEERDLLQQFSDSVWFTRGWTLQELIAPRRVVFVTSCWAPFGCRYPSQPVPRLGDAGNTVLNEDHSLYPQISLKTGIPRRILCHPDRLYQASVAQRMSWMAGRKTTRSEDTAYCLLGIFGINMPLLYGEGDKAFSRLQKEILSSTYDESIFAWSPPEPDELPATLLATPMLADTPQRFANCRHLKLSQVHDRLPATLTSLGLEIRLQPSRTGDRRSNHGPSAYQWKIRRDFILLPLNCVKNASAGSLVPQYVIMQATLCYHYVMAIHYRPDFVLDEWEPMRAETVIFAHIDYTQVKSCSFYPNIAEREWSNGSSRPALEDFFGQQASSRARDE
ncbi:HET-domain-containing protein [Teratosphaeria destructans]|uniref:HET-domain-containing protein n=1 Tax=Teratosphaeria destructans TaxID=418781 RepID=A0A9W7W375_9PEZI|nr:HET-domain-containing protein [Teratosphaeria destructans]